MGESLIDSENPILYLLVFLIRVFFDIFGSVSCMVFGCTCLSASPSSSCTAGLSFLSLLHLNILPGFYIHLQSSLPWSHWTSFFVYLLDLFVNLHVRPISKSILKVSLFKQHRVECFYSSTRLSLYCLLLVIVFAIHMILLHFLHRRFIFFLFQIQEETWLDIQTDHIWPIVWLAIHIIYFFYFVWFTMLFWWNVNPVVYILVFVFSEYKYICNVFVFCFFVLNISHYFSSCKCF